MSAGLFPGDIRSQPDPEWAEKKLAEILEFRLGRTANNQAIINDCKSAGVLFSAPSFDEVFDVLDGTGIDNIHATTYEILALCMSKAKS